MLTTAELPFTSLQAYRDWLYSAALEQVNAERDPGRKRAWAEIVKGQACAVAVENAAHAFRHLGDLAQAEALEQISPVLFNKRVFNQTLKSGFLRTSLTP